ncbi:biotin--[acetyl-CoA-carboxylase] ligase [Vagococcus xieshaowenii]|nr:biotin--[acetyl-CoA-carboxylase] ligase [Vagococcus xieshaowenii]
MKKKLLNYLMHHARQPISSATLIKHFPEKLSLLLEELSEDHSLEITQDTVIYYPEPPLSIPNLTNQLQNKWPMITIDHQAILSSTNTVLKQMIQSKEITSEHPYLLIADKQTNGRGRLGRQFVSDIYNGLYLSLYIPFNVSSHELPAFTLIAAAALTQTIEKLTGFEIGIKWVNDLYFNQKKIAGILTETTLDLETNQINGIIIGTGVNLSAFPEQIPVDLQHKMGALFEPGHESITREELITNYLNHLSSLLNDPSKAYYPIYCKHSFVLGKEISFQKNGKTITGQAVKIMEDGRLLVTLPDLSTITLLAGEISLQSY